MSDDFEERVLKKKSDLRSHIVELIAELRAGEFAEEFSKLSDDAMMHVILFGFEKGAHFAFSGVDSQLKELDERERINSLRMDSLEAAQNGEEAPSVLQ